MCAYMEYYRHYNDTCKLGWCICVPTWNITDTIMILVSWGGVYVCLHGILQTL